MKRILAWVLLMVMVLGMFAGCKPKEEPAPTTEPGTTAPQNQGVQGPGAQDAIDYLKSLYQEDGNETAVDFNRYGIIRVGGIEFNIVWTVDVSEDLVKVVANEDGTVTIDINEQCEEATPYKLTATITDANGNVASYTWNHILPKAQDMVEIVKAAYALGKGESLPYESRLIGKIITIDTIWTDEYQNITVTIAVEGAEDMPIKCYRMKATDNTLEVIKELKVGNIITVIGTLKNYEGTIEFDTGCLLEKVEKGDAVEAPTDPGQILKEAYALKQDEVLPYQATLTGVVTQIDAPYDPNYGNISVVIVVEGYEKYPMLCYRLKGTGVEDIAIDDLITVTGIIKNYRGTIEYDAGCMMIDRVSGGGVAQKPSSDAAKILADAVKLKPGESLPYRATLTGEIYSVDNAYDPGYGNVTVTIKVNGVKIQCYRMIGDGIDQIRETDKITVTGVIKNYNGKLEFDTRCNLDSWEKGPRNVNYGPVKEDVAYRLYIDQKGTGNTVYFNGQFSSNRLQTTTTGSKGADVYAERISGKGLRFFYMDGQTKTYIEIEEYTNDNGQQRGGVRVTTTPSCYWVYNSDFGVYIVNLPTAGKYLLGTYGTYETVSASWIGYIDGSVASSSAQYVAKFVEADKVQDEEPSDTIVQGTAVENPAVGTGYKFGFYQNQVEGKPFLAFAGKMAGYYMATSEKISDMTDVYLENADGGYYLYFKNGSTKTYIDIVQRETDATKVDIALRTSGTHTVYQLNTQYNYVYTTAVGSEWYLGTYGTNTSISASKTSYISDKSTIGVSQFCAWFSEVEEVEAPENPTEPTEPQPSEPVETLPVATDVLEDGDRVVIFAPAYNKALSADKVTAGSYYNKGVDITIANGSVTGYGNAEIWTVIKNADDTYSFANGGQNIGLGEEFSSMNLGAIYDDWSLVHLGGSLYNIKNEGRGNFIEWYAEKGNWSSYNSSSAATDDQFQLSIYIVGEALLGEETTEPEPTDPQPSEPAGSAALDNGDRVVIFAPAYNKALSADKVTAGSYYNKGVDITVANGEVTGYGNAEIWTVIKNADDTYSFANGGQNIGLGEEFSSMNLGAIYDDWTLISLGNGLYNIKNVGRGNIIEWYAEKGNWSSYNSSSAATDDQFQLSFYVIGEGILGDETVEPQPTEPLPSEPAGEVGVVAVPEVGTAYKLGIDIGTKVMYFTGSTTTNANFRLAVDTDAAKAADVYLEAAEGGYRLYFMKDGVKTYIRVFHYTDGDPGYGKGSLELVTTAPSEVMTFDEVVKTLIYEYDGDNAYYMGTYNSKGTIYENIAVSNTSFISGDKAANIDVSQFPARFYIVDESGADPDVTEPQPTDPQPTEPQPSEPAGETGVVEVPEVETAYKLGIDIGTKVMYFTGNTTTNATFRLAVDTDAAKAADVYLEAAEGGYRLYFMKDGVKTYIRVFHYTDGDPGYGKGSLELVTTAPSEVMTFDEVVKTLIYDYDGDNAYYMGTYNSKGIIYENIAVSNTSFITGNNASNVDVTQFPARFYIVDESGAAPDVTEPEATEPEATEPGATGNGYNKITSAAEFTSGKYVMMVSTGYAPGVYDNGWLSAVQPVISGNTVTDTKGAVWTLTVNGSSVTIADANGVVIKPKGGNNNGVSEGTYDWAWSFENGTFKFAGTGSDTVVLASNATTTGLYPGNHRFRGYKTSTVSSQASNYPNKFTLYKLGGTTGAEPEVTEPQVTEPQPTVPAGSTALKNGDQVVIYAPAYNKALSTEKVATYYNMGVDITVSNGVVTGYGDTEIWMVIVNSDGTYSFANGGQNIGLGEEFSSMNLGAIYDDWTLISLGNGLYNLKNEGRGNFMEWYAAMNNWSTHTSSSAATDGQYQISFYIIGEGIQGGGTQEPEATEPEATEPEATQPSAGSSVTYTFSNYEKGTAYGANETHVLDDIVTVITNQCFFTTQLRLYQDKDGDGTAVFESTKKISSVLINAGYRAASLEVYASVDGQNWVLIDTIAHPTKDAYADYTVEMPAGTSYKYLKLDAVGAQIRIPYMTFNFAA